MAISNVSMRHSLMLGPMSNFSDGLLVSLMVYLQSASLGLVLHCLQVASTLVMLDGDSKCLYAS